MRCDDHRFRKTERRWYESTRLRSMFGKPGEDASRKFFRFGACGSSMHGVRHEP
jgi:hypothetical protein